jgi:hypothetical protein
MEAHGGSQISTGSDNFACCSHVLQLLSEGLEIKLSDFEAEDATLKGEYLWQVVEIVIGGVQTVLEVHFVCLFMCLSRLLLEGSVSRSLFDLMRHQLDLRKVALGIYLLGNIYSGSDVIPSGIRLTPLHTPSPHFSNCFLFCVSLLDKFRSQGIGLVLSIVTGSPE